MATRKKRGEESGVDVQEAPQPQGMQPQAMPGMMPPGYGQMPPGQMPPGQMQPGMMPQGMGQPGMPQMQQQMMPQQMGAQMPQQPMMPQQMGGPMQQPMMPQQMGQMGGMPQMGYGMQMNPMFAMMQMFQQMSGGMGFGMDPSAAPFAGGAGISDGDKGLDADIIRPALLEGRVKTQEAVAFGNVLDSLCLTEDGQASLGGLPKGCTMAFVGPPGKGKTRTAIAGMCRLAAAGMRVAFIVAEEGFHDDAGSGRDDLCSRLVKIGRKATGLGEQEFDEKVLPNLWVLEAQYHKGNSWDDFVNKYRYLVEKEEIEFVVVDSLNMLDPTKNHTADNLSALKTYNHEQGVTCLCIGQVRDTGQPVGGEALQHTADAVFLIEEMSLGSKEIADFWGGKYRDKINVIHAVKCVTTPTFAHPVRIDQAPEVGELVTHAGQPADYALLPKR